MTFTLSIGLFFVIIVFYIVIVQALTILFRITGMTEEKARFQVISLITNSGYTTKESELVVDVLVRRKLARVIMLFGYVFSITVVSVFVNMMLALPTSEKDEVWPALITVSVLFVVFLIVWRIPIVKTALDAVLERVGRKWMYGDQANTIIVQDEYPAGVVAAVTLNKVPPDLAGKTLRELDLARKEGIHVVYVNRDGVLRIDTDGSTVLDQGDIATVFGPRSAIRKVFEYHAPKDDELPMAPKPETEAEYIHQQNVAAAERAAQEARQAAEQAAEEEQEAARKAEAAAEALERKPIVSAASLPTKPARDQVVDHSAAAEKKAQVSSVPPAAGSPAKPKAAPARPQNSGLDETAPYAAGAKDKKKG